eukprot:1734587-Alexandrium_andersonii.AAC.1
MRSGSESVHLVRVRCGSPADLPAKVDWYLSQRFRPLGIPRMAWAQASRLTEWWASVPRSPLGGGQPSPKRFGDLGVETRRALREGRGFSARHI